MPLHDVYIEAFVGAGAVFLKKRPAERSILIDVDQDVVAHWRRVRPPATTIVHGDARAFLSTYPWTGRELVYCDPPYLMSTRRSQAQLYRREMTPAEHGRLLNTIKRLPCAVLISGYRSALYDRALAKWRRFDFLAATHRGVALESVWCNFPPPAALHDRRFAGPDYRERERMKKKQARWRAMLEAMPEYERAAMLEVLLELAPPELSVPAAPPRRA